MPTHDSSRAPYHVFLLCFIHLFLVKEIKKKMNFETHYKY